jgi:DNA-binding MarR family transcriptional regulator
MGSTYRPRLTLQGLMVLRCFGDSDSTELPGSEVMKVTGLASGTLYPILFRFEDAGFLTSRWETDDPVVLGRPRRRFYKLTPKGAQAAQDGSARKLKQLRWVPS